MKNIKKFIALISACIMVVSFAACGQKENVYKVAMEPTFPPFDTTDSKTGELSGFDVDMMEAIAADQGFKLEWSSMSFGGLIPALESGNIDIIASGMNASKARREQVDFSDTYYDSGLVVAVKAGNKDIKSIEDLTPAMKVGGQIGTTGADKCKELETHGKIKEAKIYDGLDVAMMDLQNGTIHALINDLPVTKAYMKAKPGEVEIVGDVLNAESYGIAVKKGNKELLDKINAGMKNIKENGTFDELYNKWFE